jgi:hypothetical protein
MYVMVCGIELLVSRRSMYEIDRAKEDTRDELLVLDRSISFDTVGD